MTRTGSRFRRVERRRRARAFVLGLLAELAIAAATQDTAPDSLIPLTRNEIAHLLATVILQPDHGPAHRLHWSHWRRRHQHRARSCHYKQQAAQDQET